MHSIHQKIHRRNQTMKKIGAFVVNSIVLFWSYFLSSTLCLAALQTIMRVFVDADSKGEYLWKTVCLYAWMLVTCVIHLRATASTHKTKYLAQMEGKEWGLGEGIKYTLKNRDFWLNSIGFAIWPILIPKIFGAIHRLYFTPTFLESFPQAIISVLTVSLPIVILSAIGWVFVLYRWSKNRLHTS